MLHFSGINGFFINNWCTFVVGRSPYRCISGNVRDAEESPDTTVQYSG